MQPQTPAHLPKLPLHVLQVLATQLLAQLELKLTDHILASRQDTGCRSPASHCLRAGPLCPSAVLPRARVHTQHTSAGHKYL